MSVFFVTTSDVNDKLGKKIADIYNDNYYKVNDTQWLVVDNATTKEVTYKLKANDGQYGQIIVFRLNAYYGWHEADLWDWLSVKMQQD